MIVSLLSVCLFMKFVKTESGNTKAARPSNTSNVMTLETPNVPPTLQKEVETSATAFSPP